MQKLLAELFRLYITPDTLAPDALTRHILGDTSNAISLVSAQGGTRALAIAFDKTAGHDDQHWTQLCDVANALQSELGLPAPAVSISGANGYRLWLSFDLPMPTAKLQSFLQLLHDAYFPDTVLAPDAASAMVELPPGLHPRSGKWAAFIHPGMGASFADESGLEMAPPLAGQAGFLEGLQSISAAQLAHALDVLQRTPAPAPVPAAVASAAAPQRALPADGLLLRDATLEDIIQFLHAKKIEPTFRHLL